jgi:hypothetical protein
LFENPQGMKKLQRYRCIRRAIQNAHYENSLERCKLAQDKVQWQAVLFKWMKHVDLIKARIS